MKKAEYVILVFSVKICDILSKLNFFFQRPKGTYRYHNSESLNATPKRLLVQVTALPNLCRNLVYRCSVLYALIRVIS
jgi:hypothetical protein